MYTYATMPTVPGLFASNAVVRSDGASIAADPGNADWVAYEKWVAAGNHLAPAPAPSRATLDIEIRNGCDTAIAAGFSSGGASRRASMNLWAASALASQASGATLSADDQACLAMLPKMNAWESAMMVERDRLISAALTLADAKWPALPDGGAAFVASCNQG